MLQFLRKRIQKKNDQRVATKTVKTAATKIVKNNSDDVSEVSDDISILKKLRIEVDFELNSNDFMYNISIEVKRLCISLTVKQKVYRLIHDDAAHADIHRCYNRLAEILYISRLSRKLRRYIKHCSNCQLSQTKRHRSYDELVFIKSLPYSFYIIVINFILDLSEKMNVIFTVIDKFSRRVFTIFGKFIYNASQ